MNEGVERVYLRSWGQIKGKFGRGWFTLFQVDLGFIFFFYCFWVWKGSVSAGFRGQLPVPSLWRKKREVGVLPAVSSSVLPQPCPHQDPRFSAWCPQLGPFPTSPSFPQLLHQPSVQLSRLVTSRSHPIPGLHPSSSPSFLHIGMTLYSVA